MSATWDSKALLPAPVPADEVLIIDTLDTRNQKRVALTNFALLGINNAASLGLGVVPTEKFQMFGGNFNLKPHNPVRLATITDAVKLDGASDIHIVNGHAFVVAKDSNSITIVDISIPSAPVILGTLQDNTNLISPTGVFVAGRFAYVACTGGSGTLTAIDISTPSSPTFKSKVTIANASKVYVSGIHAFVTDPVLHKLHIIDIHEPAMLTLDGTFTDAINLLNISNVYVSGRYAYLTAEGGNRLTILDVFDDENPTLKGTLQDNTNMNGPKAVYVVGNHAYVVSNVGDSLAIINVGVPATPVFVSSLLNPVFESNNVLNGATSIFVGENHAYIASADVSAVVIVNVLTHSAPVIVGAVVDVPNLGDVSSLFLSGKHLCSVSPTNNSFSSIDIHGVDVPTADIGSMEVGTLSVRDNVIIADDLYTGTLNTANSALIGGQLSVSEKLKVFGDLSAGDNTLHVDVVNKVVQIGGDTIATDLTIFQQATLSRKGITLSGLGITGSSLTDGVLLIAGNIAVGNMQLWVGQKTDINLVGKTFFRYIVGGDVPTIDGVSGNNQFVRNIIIGQEGSNVGFGFNAATTLQANIVSKLHVKAGSTNNIAQIIQAFGAQTVDLLQVRNSAGTPQVVIDKDFKLGIGLPNPDTQIHIKSIAAVDAVLKFTETGGQDASIGIDASEDVLNLGRGFGVSDLIIDLVNGRIGVGQTSTGSMFEVFGGDSLVNFNSSSATGSPIIALSQAGARKAFIRYLDTNDQLQLVSEFGDIVFYTGVGGAETLKLTLTETGILSTGGEIAPDASAGGLTLQQNAANGFIQTLKSSDVAHGMTGLAETDTYGTLGKVGATEGGFNIQGFSEITQAVVLKARQTTQNTVDTSAAIGAITLDSALKSGTSVTVVGDAGNLVVVSNNTNAKFLIKGNGDTHIFNDLKIDGNLEIDNPANTFKYIITGGAINMANRILNLPLITGTDTLAALDVVQTWSAKQIFMNNLMDINNPANTFAYQFQSSAITANRTVTLPLLTANDTFAMLGVANVFTVDQRISGSTKLIIGDGLNTFIRAPTNDIIEVFAGNNLRLIIRDEGPVLGGGSTSTSRVTDFVHLPISAGKPTGAADLITNHVPAVFDTGDNSLYVFNNSVWNQVSNKTFARRIKIVDETVVNDTLQDDDKLSIPLRANKVYAGILTLFFESPVAASFKYEFSVPTGATGFYNAGGNLSSTVPVTASTITGQQSGLVTAGSDEMIVIKFTVKTLGTVGNITFRWAQNTTSGTTTVRTGSDMVIWEQDP